MNDAATWITHTLAQRAPCVGAMPAALRPTSLDAGYALQAHVTALLSAGGHGPTIGWKVGSTTPSMQALLGVPQPAAGRMFTSSLIARGSEVDFGRYRRPAVECEIAVRLSRPLDARDSPLAMDAVVAAIDTVHPAIELVDDRYGDFALAGAALMVSDHFFHSGLVLGEAVPAWRHLDLAALRGSTWVDGEERLVGRGADVLGHPLNSVIWLASHLARQGRRLEAGEIITTGSLPLPLWALPGQRVEIRIEHLGGVDLRFTA
jgi:2-oxo-3-hexenedioate decarboxylase/2-keto-4-pentenoate hydratase